MNPIKIFNIDLKFNFKDTKKKIPYSFPEYALTEVSNLKQEQ